MKATMARNQKGHTTTRSALLTGQCPGDMLVMPVWPASVRGVQAATSLPVHCTLYGGVILRLSSMTLARTERRRKQPSLRIQSRLTRIGLSRQSTKGHLRVVLQQFYDRMIHEKSLNQNSIVQYGKQGGRLQQQDWRSSRFKLASQCLSTKARENTTLLPSPWMRLASMSGLGETSGSL